MSELTKYASVVQGAIVVKSYGEYYKTTEADAIIAKLRSELAEAKKDAERYKMLKIYLGFKCDDEFSFKDLSIPQKATMIEFLKG